MGAATPLTKTEVPSRTLGQTEPGAGMARGVRLEPNKDMFDPRANGPGWNPTALTTAAMLPGAWFFKPNTSKLSVVPTYTFPFAMVGVENLMDEPMFS